MRRHGPHRVMGKLMAMRIDRDLAKEVVRELFGEDDEEALLEQTLETRLRGKPERLKDPARAPEDPRLPRPPGLLRLASAASEANASCALKPGLRTRTSSVK